MVLFLCGFYNFNQLKIFKPLNFPNEITIKDPAHILRYTPPIHQLHDSSCLKNTQLCCTQNFLSVLKIEYLF
jgi:hypothetical protein